MTQYFTDRDYWLLVSVLALTFLTDLLTTFVGIHVPHLAEQNQSAVNVLQSVGWVGLGGFSAVGLLAVIGLTRVVQYVPHPRSFDVSVLLVGGCVMVKGGVTLWNGYLILQAV